MAPNKLSIGVWRGREANFTVNFQLFYPGELESERAFVSDGDLPASKGVHHLEE